MYVFQLFDYFSVSRTIFIIAFLECVVIAYVYGMSDMDKLYQLLWLRFISCLIELKNQLQIIKLSNIFKDISMK